MAIDFHVQDFFHPFLIGRLWHEFKQNQWLSADELMFQQEDRLRTIIKHAFDHVPYYRSRLEALEIHPSDIRTLGDLRKLPVLSKASAIAAGNTLRASKLAGLHPVEYHTSGTSGTPFSVLHCKYSNALEFVYYWRHWNWAGYRLGDSFAQLSTLYFIRRKEEDRTTFWQPHLRRLLISSFQISAIKAEEIAHELDRRRCRFLKGVASTTYHLALSMHEAGVNPRPLHAVISTGEVLLPQQQSLIEKVFGCRVYDSYGHMERTIAISQCEHGQRHINSDYGIPEFINQRNCDNGTTFLAEALGTGLHNLAMPFIRYETGDTFELYKDPRPCSCGRTFPVIKAIHGRQEDVIITPDGRFLTTLFVLPEFVSGISETQFVQDAEDRLVVRVVPSERFDAVQEEKLKAFTQMLTGPCMHVHVQRCGRQDLMRSGSGKRRMVIPLHSHGKSNH